MCNSIAKQRRSVGNNRAETSELSSYWVTIDWLTQLVGCRFAADCDNALNSFFSRIRHTKHSTIEDYWTLHHQTFGNEKKIAGEPCEGTTSEPCNRTLHENTTRAHRRRAQNSRRFSASSGPMNVIDEHDGVSLHFPGGVCRSVYCFLWTSSEHACYRQFWIISNLNSFTHLIHILIAGEMCYSNDLHPRLVDRLGYHSCEIHSMNKIKLFLRNSERSKSMEICIRPVLRSKTRSY